jgi:hypothetical protein
MKRLLVCLLLVAVVGCGGDLNTNEQANKLFVEAVQLIALAEARSHKGWDEEAVKDYEKALLNVHKIIDDYDTSDIAVKLISGDTLFTGNTLADIRDELALAELRVMAQPLATLGTISYDHDRNVIEADLRNSLVSNTDLVLLREQVGLKRLILQSTHITDAGLEHLKRLPNLRYLNLENTNITNGGLIHIKGLRLEELGLSGTNVNDAGLEHLSELSTLRNLYLNRTNITDAGLVHLEKLRSLTFLSVIDTQVTGEAVREFEDALPSVTLGGVKWRTLE